MSPAAITATFLALVSLSSAESNVQCRFGNLIAVWEYVQNQMSGGKRVFLANDNANTSWKLCDRRDGNNNCFDLVQGESLNNYDGTTSCNNPNYIAWTSNAPIKEVVKVSSDASRSHSTLLQPNFFGFIEGPWNTNQGEQQEVSKFLLCGEDDFINEPPEIQQRDLPSPEERSPNDFCPDGSRQFKAEVEDGNVVSNDPELSASFDELDGETIISWKLSGGFVADDAVVKAGSFLHVQLFDGPTPEGNLTNPLNLDNDQLVDISFIGLCARYARVDGVCSHILYWRLNASMDFVSSNSTWI